MGTRQAGGVRGSDDRRWWHPRNNTGPSDGRACDNWVLRRLLGATPGVSDIVEVYWSLGVPPPPNRHHAGFPPTQRLTSRQPPPLQARRRGRAGPWRTGRTRRRRGLNLGMRAPVPAPPCLPVRYPSIVSLGVVMGEKRVRDWCINYIGGRAEWLAGGQGALHGGQQRASRRDS